MSLKYLSHRSEDGQEETILQHLQETAEMAAQFAAPFGAEEQARLAGMLHDIGKYSDAFQRRLNGSPERVDHATAGAWECAKAKQPFAAFAIAGHHGGLPNGGSKTDNVDQSTLHGRMNRAGKNLLEPYGHWQEELPAPPLRAAPPAFLASGRSSPGDLMFFIRMLYSCLVDADFLCTERFMAGRSRDTSAPSMEALEDLLNEKTAGWFPPKTQLNEQRCAILQRCRTEGRARTPGLFTLTVPTGGGKTIASLAFALAHARKNHLRRIIYVIPYTSIIEQNAQVFRDYLGENAVLEHHSGVLYDIDGEASPEKIHMAQATENWDMPVVVTTAVQFFESLFANRSAKCRKLHNLADSVIIFDEAQMTPIPYLRPCIYAISQLVSHYGASAVLCTATQPALGPLFREFLPGQEAVELCPPEIYDGSIFRRTSFRVEGKLSWDELSRRLNDLPQVLCIVNSRKAAQEIFSRLEGEGSFHLSTLMYPAHRQAVLKRIRQRLKAGLPCRVVSTSLIEAGVDVDFPAVFREEAGLDSILQAAGRCNREGKHSAADSVVTVFQSEGTTPSLFSIPIGAWQLVAAQHPDIAGQEAISCYFRNLLDLKGRQEQDKHQILSQVNSGAFPFREIAEEFRLIEQNTRTIYIPLEEGETLVERLREGERSRGLFRKLGKYSVAVYENQFTSLDFAGALELLEDGSAILLNTDLYNAETGLARSAESGNALFL